MDAPRVGRQTLAPLQLRAKEILRGAPYLRAAVLARRHRDLLPDDVFLASFPRSGNTWLRFVLADLATGDRADYERIEQLVPAVGRHAGAPPLAAGSRLIKTHEPYRTEYRRAIYLVRDVRDVVISWYRTTRHDRDDFSAFDAFVERFAADGASPYGRWTDHVRSWLRASERAPDILVLRYEDLQADPVARFGEIAAFAGLPRDRARLQEAQERNAIGEMQGLQAENAEYLQRAFGYRNRDTSGTAGGRRHQLKEHHLRVLHAELALNRELGYTAK